MTETSDKAAEEHCKEIAEAKGLNVKGYFENGSLVYPFADDYGIKGCYFYKGGHKKYDGLAFYGRGGTKAQLEDPGKRSKTFDYSNVEVFQAFYTAKTFERIPLYFFESCIKK